MSMIRLAENVETYAPETDLAKLNLEALRTKGWSEHLVAFLGRQRHGSKVLREFEKRVTSQHSFPPHIEP